MKAIILAGGYGTRLWPLTQEIPKCFLEFGGKKVIEYIFEKIEPLFQIDEIIISTNSKFQGQFEEWLAHYNFSKDITLVVEETYAERNKLGAIKAIDFVVKHEQIEDDILIIAGDNLFEFDLRDFVNTFIEQKQTLLAINDITSFDFRQKVGVVNVDSNDNITCFEEKPKEPKTTLVCAGLYIFPKKELGCFSKYLDEEYPPDSIGYLFEWLLSQKSVIKAWKFETAWFDIGTEKPYLEAKKRYSRSEQKIAKVLVTGGAGYLGGVLVSDLLEEGFYVRVLDSLLYDFDPDDRVEFIQGDVRDRDTAQDTLKDMDFVVHLAALSNDPSCDISFNRALEINYNGTKLVTTLAKEAGVRRVLFPSSCSIYGAAGGEDFVSEMSPLKPISFYAQMKVASEMQIKELVDDNFDACILRLATLYGHSPNMRFDLIGNIIPVEALIDGTIKLFGGSQCRPLLHVRDASQAIIRALKSENIFHGESFNVGSDEDNYSVRELTEILQSELFKEIPIKEFPEEIDSRSYKVSFKRFEEEVGFKTKVNVAEGVEEIANKIRNDLYGNPRDEKYFRVKYLLKKGLDSLALGLI